MSLIRKRQLTVQQNRRIVAQQQKGQDAPSDEGAFTGLIISHYGKQQEVLALDGAFAGQCWRCHTRTNLPLLVTGDKVRWQADENTKLGIITALLPRYSVLTRPDRYHKLKPVAANIDLICIVIAPLPVPALQLIDRYLVAAARAHIPAILILNKQDLLTPQADHQQLLAHLQEYEQLGVTCLRTQHDHTLDTLKPLLHQKTVVFVGQSGVGKSSLINVLTGEQQKVYMLSENSKLGQHTTTSARLFQLADSGAVIDSPGIREFGLWHLNVDDVILGFADVAKYVGQCKFRNCSHRNTAHCGLTQAVADGHLLQRRLDSYLSLCDEVAEHTQQRKHKP